MMLKDLLENATKKMILEYLEETHPHDLSEMFFELTDQEKEKLYRLISDEKLAEIVSYMDTEQAADILTEFDLEKQKRLFEMMEPDDAADIILEFEDEEQEDIIELLGESSDVVQLMNYDDDETGSAMTNLVIKIFPEMDVKEATKKVIREANEVETISTLFAVDHEGIFLGTIPLRKLLRAKTPMPVSEIIEITPFVYDHDPITHTVEAISNYNIFEMPVCDNNQKLLGMITLDDALDIYQEEAQEDFEKLAGLPETLDETVVRTAFHRLPWLVILLIIAIPIAMVTSIFEKDGQGILAQVAILIVFQPLILDSAGNVATQTLAVTLKMFSTNEKGFFSNALKEILTGFINGFVIGIIAFIMTFVFANLNTSLTSNPILISFVVGFSLWMTVFTAPVFAILIPWTLKALKFDPAVASGPFITTIIDVTALFIYFGLATLLLGGI